MRKYEYRGVIFDLDGVLTDTAHYHYLAWKRLAESIGASFDEAFNEQLKGVDRMGSLNLILEASGKDFSEAYKLTLADEKNLHYQSLIAQLSPADLLPGAAASLQLIRAAGLKTALASVSKNAQAVIERLGIADQFDVVVDAAKIKNSKPDPEIFLTADKVKPEELTANAAVIVDVLPPPVDSILAAMPQPAEHKDLVSNSCVACHTKGIRGASVSPEDHVDYINDSCSTCHVLP